MRDPVVALGLCAILVATAEMLHARGAAPSLVVFLLCWVVLSSAEAHFRGDP